MLITQTRDHFSPTATLGYWEVEGSLKAYTVERPCDKFNAAVRCIPVGLYNIGLYDSPHFGRVVPILKDVPDHDYIEIHWGNWATDSKGCIILGTTRDVVKFEVLESKNKFDELFPIIENAVNSPDGCQIMILNGLDYDEIGI